MDIYYFPGKINGLSISEFGHSIVKDEKVGWRVRTTYLLHIVVSGNGDFCGDTFKSGNAFLILPRTVHEFTFNGTCEHYWFAFGGTNVEEVFRLAGLSLKQGVYNVCNGKNLMRFISDSFRDTHENFIPPLNLLISCLFSLSHQGSVIPVSEQSDYCNAGISLMLNSLDRRISISDIAKRLGISEKYFYKIFKARYGLSPQKYLIAQKMSAARELLKGTDYNMEIIAESVGYDSAAAFSRQFKSSFGVPPVSFRTDCKKT